MGNILTPIYLRYQLNDLCSVIRIYFQIKIYLKPAFNQGVIEKNTYKTIMKKCVDKVYEKSKTDHVSTDRVKRLVEAYITQERQNAIKEKLALKR
jgi:hypothetical protein